MKFFSSDLAKKIRNAPLLPGCYIYKDKDGKILYIGKAIEIRSRVKSYFVKNADLLPRIRIMVQKIRDVEFITVDSEAEALVLETNLIHKYRPKYNSEKKDDKNYQWLKFLKNEDFKRPLLVREKKDDDAEYFGPYPESLPLKRTLKYLRKVFPYRTCNRIIKQTKINPDGSPNIYSSDPKPCLYYHLGLCPAPCASKISKIEYSKNIKYLKEYFTHKKSHVIYRLKEEMAEVSKEQKYEEAAELRDKINDLIYISQRIEVESIIDEEKFKQNRNLTKVKALSDLLEIIDDKRIIFKDNLKIECYDISNIQGKLAVGSMVVFVNGVPARNLYRKFRIKLKNSPDDFAMMQEVFSRRFSEKNLKSKDLSFKDKPDLIIVDGGKGQLSSAFKILKNLNIEIPIIGLAKKNEDIFTIKDNGIEFIFEKKILKEGTEPRFLMQRIRDEAHRFGITYHRDLRLKAQKFSILSTIPGVGKMIGEKLLKSFGSIENIKSADIKEINLIIKNKKTAQNIKKML